MATTSDISRGAIIKLNDFLYQIVDFGQNKTARSAAKVWAKLKGVDNNRTIEHTWNSGENVHFVRVEKRNFQFLYKDESGYAFMDNASYEQLSMTEESMNAPQFLKEGQEVSIAINDETGQPLFVELPDKVALKIISVEPGVRGDTATRATKNAVVETGATIQVPLFIEEGELIKVNTANGTYAERVKV